jgi:exo-beta-1,3-glucanase (GH17 family)
MRGARPLAVCRAMETRTVRNALCLAGALALLACAGDNKEVEMQGEPDAGADDTPFVRRAIPADVLARKAIAYSGYRTGQTPEQMKYPSKAEVQEDLELLVRGGWTFIRLFDASTHAEHVLEVIEEQKLDMKVLQGAWISGNDAEHGAANKAQLDKAVALANQYPDIIAAVSVGNETLDSWSNVLTPVKDLAGYIENVRSRVAQPVTTDDSWLPFMLESDGDFSYANVIEVARVCDFLSLHVYAFADAFWGSWDYQRLDVEEAERPRAMMDAALAYNKEAIELVRQALTPHGLGDIPIVLGEIGWKDRTEFSPEMEGTPPEDAIEFYMAHAINQKMFYDDLQRWVYGTDKDATSPLTAFYFEAFDEPWKGEWGDDHWGLFDVERKAKYVIWGEFSDLKPEGAVEPKASDAACYRPPAE